MKKTLKTSALHMLDFNVCFLLSLLWVRTWHFSRLGGIFLKSVYWTKACMSSPKRLIWAHRYIQILISCIFKADLQRTEQQPRVVLSSECFWVKVEKWKSFKNKGESCFQSKAKFYETYSLWFNSNIFYSYILFLY